MERARKVAYVRHELIKARDDLETARVLLAAGKHRRAVICAYYTIFHFASAALLWHGEERSKHSGVEAAFKSVLVRQHSVEDEYFRIFLKARKTREEQDYSREALFPSEEEARQSIADAERFVARVERYLREAGALEEEN
ncbi:MAG: HEPN domain-containing protein [Chloroflexi bacterium]|nr:HEPN domain-containing protein [Chloroflexota bacterium]